MPPPTHPISTPYTLHSTLRSPFIRTLPLVFYFSFLIFHSPALAVDFQKTAPFEAFDTPAAAESWNYFWGNGGSARTATVPDPENSANHAGAFHCTFSSANAYVVMAHASPLPPDTSRLTLRVHSTGAGPSLLARLHDAAGETLAYKLCDAMDWTGWKTFTIDTASPTQSWGGNNDKKPDWPAGLALHISAAQPGNATFLIDDITATFNITDANRYAFTIANQPLGNIFLGADPAPAVAFHLLDRAAQAGDFSLESHVFDQHGDILAHTTQPLRLAAADTAPATITVPLTRPGYGYYRVTATLRKSGGALIGHLATTAAIVPPVPAAGAADTPFGMNLSLATRYGADRAQAAKLASQSGVKWTRDEFSWERIEPVKGQYNWDRFDAGVQAARDANLNILGLIGYAATWARRDPASYTSPPRDFNDYAHFVFTLVSRYKDTVKHWEIWNEPDCNGFWPPGADPADYTALLKAAHAAAKRADPDCSVLVGGLLVGVNHSDMWGFLNDMYQHGAAGSFDILGWHPYADPRSPEAGRYTDRTQTLVDILKKHNDPRPVWCTEQAWATTPGNFRSSDETLQSYYIVRSHVLALANPAVEKFIWFLFRDGGNRDHDYEQSYGILNPDYTPKPALPPYVFMTRILAGATPVAPLPVAGNPAILANEFKNGDTSTIILWTTGDDPIQLPYPATPATDYFDPCGNKSTPAHLLLTQQPVYLRTTTANIQNLRARLAAATATPVAKPAPVPLKPIILDDFSDIQWGTAWKLGWFGSGHEGTTLATVPDPENKFPSCALLDYAVDPAKGKYGLCYVQVDKPIPLPETTASIGIWVLGDNSGVPLITRVIDRNGETFQFRLAEKIDWTGWRYCEAPLDQPRVHHFGGDENGRLDPPFHFQSLNISIEPARATTGRLHFANLTITDRAK